MKVYSITEDGIQHAQDAKPGTLAFIFDGCILSGWPLKNAEGYENASDSCWEGNSDVSFGKFTGVKKYVIFDKPLWEL